MHSRHLTDKRDAMNVDVAAASWPHKWFGFFRKPDDEPSQFPLIEEFVQNGWQAAEKDRIVFYLSTAVAVLATSGTAPCPICGARLARGVFYSDNEWLWPGSLSHKVEKHEVRLPDAMYTKIAAAGFLPPKTCEPAADRLPWPDRR